MGISYSGKQLARDLLRNVVDTPITHYGWGAGSQAFVDTDIALGSELFPSGAGTQRNAVYSQNIYETETQFTGRLETDQLDQGSLFEIGVFTAQSGGTLFARQNYYLLFKTTGLNLIDDFNIQIRRSGYDKR